MPTELAHGRFDIWSYWETDVNEWLWSWACYCGKTDYPFTTLTEVFASAEEHYQQGQKGDDSNVER